MKRHRLCLFLLVFLALPSMPTQGVLSADDPDAVAKSASDSLRAAERDMMNGQKDTAVETFIQAARLVEKLREIAPSHGQLAALDSKAAKLKKDLEKRTGKTIDVAVGAAKEEKPAPAPETPEKAGPFPAPAKLPGGVTHRLGKMDAPLKRAAEMLDEGKGNLTEDYRIQEAAAQIVSARELLHEIQSGYADSMGHAEVKAMEARVAEAEARLEAFRLKKGGGVGREASRCRRAGCALRRVAGKDRSLRVGRGPSEP